MNLDVAYVGSHGVDTGAATNLNPGLIVGAGSAGQPYFQNFGRTVAETEYFQGFSSSYQLPAGQVRPPLHLAALP